MRIKSKELCFEADYLADVHLAETSAKPSGIKYVFVNGREVGREGTAIPGKKCGPI